MDKAIAQPGFHLNKRVSNMNLKQTKTEQNINFM